MVKKNTISAFLFLSLFINNFSVIAAGSVSVSTFPPFVDASLDDPFLLMSNPEHQEKDSQIPAPTTKQLACIALGTPVQPDTIFTENETRELEYETLINAIDNTKTGFGFWALRSMTVPISDKEKILHRQSVIKSLTTDDQKSRRIRQLLNQIKHAEKALLNYWNPYEWEKASSLFHKAESLYYHTIPNKSVNDSLNRKKLMLDGVSVFDGIMTFKTLAFFLGAETFINDWTDYTKEGTSFNLFNTLAKAAKSPLRDFNFVSSNFSEPYDQSVKEYWQRMRHGTLWDKWEVNAKWSNDVGPINFGFGDCYPNTSIVNSIENNSLCRWFARFSSLTGAASWAGLKAYLLYTGVKNACTSLKNIYQTGNELQTHMVTVRRGLCAMKELNQIMKQDQSDVFFDDEILYSSDIQWLFDLLEKDTFKEPNLKLYSRGNVLLAHRLLQEHKDELVSLFRSVGEIDAYLSMAGLYKKSQEGDARFCFVEFVDNHEPFIEITNGWVPLINQEKAVCNSLSIGGNHSRGVIITGPNGGGKSATLKMIGVIVLLAQSWGLAPAERVRMTCLDILRTSFNPGENMSDDMSRFMAQKDSIEEIKQTVFFASQDQKIMILGDEAFTGTVEAVSANLTYDFAKEMIHQPNVLTVLATHVEKPIKLADEYPANCANYQVEIVRLPEGGFTRTYLLKNGPAKWWFDDEALRNEYVPWLGQAIKALKKSKMNQG